MQHHSHIGQSWVRALRVTQGDVHTLRVDHGDEPRDSGDFGELRGRSPGV